MLMMMRALLAATASVTNVAARTCQAWRSSEEWQEAEEDIAAAPMATSKSKSQAVHLKAKLGRLSRGHQGAGYSHGDAEGDDGEEGHAEFAGNDVGGDWAQEKDDSDNDQDDDDDHADDDGDDGHVRLMISYAMATTTGLHATMTPTTLLAPFSTFATLTLHVGLARRWAHNLSQSRRRLRGLLQPPHLRRRAMKEDDDEDNANHADDDGDVAADIVLMITRRQDDDDDAGNYVFFVDVGETACDGIGGCNSGGTCHDKGDGCDNDGWG